MQTLAIGLDVFIYKAQDGFRAPVPGLVTGVYPAAPTVCDVEAFFPKRVSDYHVTPFERVPFAGDEQEARQHFAKGAKVVAGPRDGRNPKPFVDEVPPQMVDATDEGIEHEKKADPLTPPRSTAQPRKPRPAPGQKPADAALAK